MGEKTSCPEYDPHDPQNCNPGGKRNSLPEYVNHDQYEDAEPLERIGIQKSGLADADGGYGYPDTGNDKNDNNLINSKH